MKNYTTNKPTFSESIEIIETTDPAHADNVNAAPKQLLQNTLDNRKLITEQKKSIDEVYTQSTGYTDLKIAELINGAPSTMDTLKEIADAMKENQDVVKALNAAIGNKANEQEFEAHRTNDNIHVTASEKRLISASHNMINSLMDLFSSSSDSEEILQVTIGGISADGSSNGAPTVTLYTTEVDSLVTMNGYVVFVGVPDNTVIGVNTMIDTKLINANSHWNIKGNNNMPLFGSFRLKEGEKLRLQIGSYGMQELAQANIHYTIKVLPLLTKVNAPI